MEVFKRIKDFPEYAITKTGKVKNIKLGKIINQTKVANSNYVYMYRDGKQHGRSVARLVAIAFVNNPKKYKFVAHKDGEFLNVDSTNLVWVKDTRKAKAKRPYKEYKNRLTPDYEWLDNLRILDKAYLDKLNHFK